MVHFLRNKKKMMFPFLKKKYSIYTILLKQIDDVKNNSFEHFFLSM